MRNLLLKNPSDIPALAKVFFLFREECHRALKCRPTQNVPQNGRRENKILGFYTRIFVRRLRACRMRKIHWATTTNRFNTVILIVPSYGKRRYASSENGGSMKPSTSTREVEGGEVKFLPRLDPFFPVFACQSCRTMIRQTNSTKWAWSLKAQMTLANFIPGWQTYVGEERFSLPFRPTS